MRLWRPTTQAGRTYRTGTWIWRVHPAGHRKNHAAARPPRTRIDRAEKSLPGWRCGAQLRRQRKILRREFLTTSGFSLRPVMPVERWARRWLRGIIMADDPRSTVTHGCHAGGIAGAGIFATKRLKRCCARKRCRVSLTSNKKRCWIAPWNLLKAEKVVGWFQAEWNSGRAPWARLSR